MKTWKVLNRNMESQAEKIVGLENIRNNRIWFLILGILLVILGTVAIGEAFVLTVFSMKLFGGLLIVAGIAQVCHSFTKGRGWKGFLIDLLTGILYLVIGGVALGNPGESAVMLTLIIAITMAMEGLLHLFGAIRGGVPHRVWMFLHGAASLTFGVFLYLKWPISGLWAIGVFVGVNLVLNGWSLVMLSVALGSGEEARGESPTS